jgi:hypothetical protein
MAPSFFSATFVSLLLASANALSIDRRNAELALEAEILHKRALTIPASPVTGWNFKSCWIDNTGSRTLNGASMTSNTLTIESCINFCAAGNYVYAGMEYSDECCKSLFLDLSLTARLRQQPHSRYS